MLFKSFALFAAFAASVPAFAAPTSANDGVSPAVGNVAGTAEYDSALHDEVAKLFEFSRRDDGCSLVEVDGIIENVLNNATITVLKRSDCNSARAAAEIRDVLNNAKANALSSRSKRDGENVYSFDQIKTIVTDVWNNKKTDKRDNSVVSEIAAKVVDSLQTSGSTSSKPTADTISQVAGAVKRTLDGVTGSLSKRTDNSAIVEQIIDEYYTQVAKYTNVNAVTEGGL
jgi:hypothetical protein